MLLSQGRYWRAVLGKEASAVQLALHKETLSAEQSELRDLRIEVPLSRWNTLIKNVDSDRKLLGGILLDFASHKEYVSTAIASDRLLCELRWILLEATAALVEAEVVQVLPRRSDGESA